MNGDQRINDPISVSGGDPECPECGGYYVKLMEQTVHSLHDGRLEYQQEFFCVECKSIWVETTWAAMDDPTIDSHEQTQDPDLEYCPHCKSDYVQEGTTGCRLLHSGAYEYSVPMVCMDCGATWAQVWVYPSEDD
jgi:transposase-like protein